MIQNAFAVGEPVCWIDDDGVWRHGTVRAMKDGTLEVKNSTTNNVARIDADVGCTSAPTIPFKTSAHAKTPESRVLLHAISEAIYEVGVSWADVGLVWTDNIPTVVFADSVPNSRINAVRIAVDSTTSDDIVPKQRHCEALKL